MFTFLPILAVLVAAGPARAELSLGQLRVKFEAAMEASTEEHRTEIARLDDGYAAGLERLKTSLGREEKLEQALMVVEEIDRVAAGRPAGPLPEGSDYRLENLRNTWRRSVEELEGKRQRRVGEIAGKYLALLDERKRLLTRAGKIREAAVVDEELKRAAALPAVQASMEKDDDQVDAAGDLSTFLPGCVFSYIRKGKAALTLHFHEEGRASFVEYPGKSYEWKLKGSKVVVLSQEDWAADVEIEFAEDKLSFEAKRSRVLAPPSGKFLRREP